MVPPGMEEVENLNVEIEGPPDYDVYVPVHEILEEFQTKISQLWMRINFFSELRTGLKMSFMKNSLNAHLVIKYLLCN